MLAMTIAAVTAASGAPSTEVRGLWVPRGAITTPAAIDALVTDASEAGITDLLVQVRGRGEALYRSDLEPRASELAGQPPSFDPLGRILEAARPAGLRVHAWVNLNLVSSAASLPSSSRHVANRRPDWLMVPRDLSSTLADVAPASPAYLATLARWSRGQSGQVEGLYLSPVAADARAYSRAIIEELVRRYALDGVHLDYVRYPSEAFDYSAPTLAAFRAARWGATPVADRRRLDEAAAVDPAAWTTAEPEAWGMFLRDALTTLVADVQAAARAVRPGLVISAAVVPRAADAREQKRQDWPVWARAGYLDAICPMIYTTSADEFDATLRELSIMAGDTPYWAGIGAYRLPVTGTIEHLRRARRAGPAGVVLFSYAQLADEGETASLAAFRGALLEAPSGAPLPRARR